MWFSTTLSCLQATGALPHTLAAACRGISARPPARLPTPPVACQIDGQGNNACRGSHGNRRRGDLLLQIQAFFGHRFDCVLTVCDQAPKRCPTFPASSHSLYWGVPDSANDQGPHEEQNALFCHVRDHIRKRGEAFVHVGLVSAVGLRLPPRPQAPPTTDHAGHARLFLVGIHNRVRLSILWIPACAGMTTLRSLTRTG